MWTAAVLQTGHGADQWLAFGTFRCGVVYLAVLWPLLAVVSSARARGSLLTVTDEQLQLLRSDQQQWECVEAQRTGDMCTRLLGVIAMPLLEWWLELP
jgi:hypothetical protein